MFEAVTDFSCLPHTFFEGPPWTLYDIRKERVFQRFSENPIKSSRLYENAFILSEDGDLVSGFVIAFLKSTQPSPNV